MNFAQIFYFVCREIVIFCQVLILHCAKFAKNLAKHEI